MGTYSDRLHNVIPGGAHTYSRGDDQFPANAPEILASGKGAYVRDASGKEFLDYGMGLRSVTLGYANDRVNGAAMRQMANGVNLTRASLVELEAAELIVDLIPGADMVKFAKNGSNVTTAAVKIGRAYTGRKFVCVPRQHPFFSFDDWFIGATAVKRGIPEEHYTTTLVFNYGDLSSLQDLFDQYPGQIACVLMEPATTVWPCPGTCAPATLSRTCGKCPKREENFLHQVKRLCRKYGSVFVLDEMITGFRWHLQGAQTYFDVEPDMSTFGKGMANGFALAALVGRRELMKLGGIREVGTERTFLISTTHGSEMMALGAFIEAVKIYREENVIEHLWKYGEKLFRGMNAISRAMGLSDYFYMEGGYPLMNYVTKNQHGEVSLGLRTIFSQEMIRNNVLMPWVAFSLAHQERELDRTFDAVSASLEIYRRALEGRHEDYLEGPAIKPVFRSHN